LATKPVQSVIQYQNKSVVYELTWEWDILCIFSLDKRTGRRMSLMFRPWFICRLPAHQTNITSKTHGSIVSYGIWLVVKSCLCHWIWQCPSI